MADLERYSQILPGDIIRVTEDNPDQTGAEREKQQFPAHLRPPVRFPGHQSFS